MSVVATAEIKARPLDARLFELDGISRRQIEEHYTLYEGYVKKTNELRSKIPSADKAAANQTFSDLRELKVELSFAWNGVKLHEGYFANLGPSGRPGDKLRQLVERSYGSMEEWEADFKASGICARGWVICAYDFDENRLYNYIADAHNSYGIWNAVPILILDTYEHAYMIDYGVKRQPYIDAFWKNINWDEVNRRVEGIVVAEPRMAI